MRHIAFVGFELLQEPPPPVLAFNRGGKRAACSGFYHLTQSSLPCLPNKDRVVEEMLLELALARSHCCLSVKSVCYVCGENTWLPWK